MKQSNKKLTTSQWISKAIKVHNDKYNYSKVIYKCGRIKIKIICPIHGDFLQSPSDHTNAGKGCVKCGILKRAENRTMTVNDFINKSNKIHQFKYNYDDVVYIGSQIKVKIRCLIHGIFTQLPTNHLSGKGCSKCGAIKTGDAFRFNKEVFIIKSNILHNNKYDYSKVIYKNNRFKVRIICPIHGEFLQKPMVHLTGSGCPSCSISGFDPVKKCYLYVLYSADKNIIKIGITNNVTNRLYSLKCYTPFKFKLLKYFNIPGKYAFDIEKSIHQKGVRANLKNFQGYTEWFLYDVNLLNHIDSYIYKESLT